MLASMPSSRAITVDLTRDPAVALPTNKPYPPVLGLKPRFVADLYGAFPVK
jgi:hypothetical protein